jgi:DNA gyrase/topoisomerase IV subunit B
MDLYERIRDDIKEKYDRKNKLDLNILKSDKNLAFELNNIGCYFECKSSDKSMTELIICEGVSSGDYVEQLRNSEYQAVFELKGKPINALQTDFKEAMTNKIYSDLLRVLGTSPRDTELNDLRFGKIILLADPDPK